MKEKLRKYVEEFKDGGIKRNEKAVENDRKKENVTIRKNKVGGGERIEGRKNARKNKRTR
jgi:hypothetical protein